MGRRSTQHAHAMRIMPRMLWPPPCPATLRLPAQHILSASAATQASSNPRSPPDGIAQANVVGDAAALLQVRLALCARAVEAGHLSLDGDGVHLEAGEEGGKERGRWQAAKAQQDPCRAPPPPLDPRRSQRR